MLHQSEGIDSGPLINFSKSAEARFVGRPDLSETYGNYAGRQRRLLEAPRTEWAFFYLTLLGYLAIIVARWIATVGLILQNDWAVGGFREPWSPVWSALCTYLGIWFFAPRPHSNKVAASLIATNLH